MLRVRGPLCPSLLFAPTLPERQLPWARQWHLYGAHAPFPGLRCVCACRGDAPCQGGVPGCSCRNATAWPSARRSCQRYGSSAPRGGRRPWDRGWPSWSLPSLKDSVARRYDLRTSPTSSPCCFLTSAELLGLRGGGRGLRERQYGQFHQLEESGTRGTVSLAVGRHRQGGEEDGAQRPLLTAHTQCRELLRPGEHGVFAAPAGERRCWHPACFTCQACGQALVDLIYFHHDGHLYCGRHHAELLRPRCPACDQVHPRREGWRVGCRIYRERGLGL